MKINWKALGVITTLAGGALTLLSNIIEDKKMEEVIAEKVAEAVAKIK